jgi:CBS domain-containing protein
LGPEAPLPGVGESAKVEERPASSPNAGWVEVAMKTVRDVMSRDVEVLKTTETAADAAGYLAAHVDDAVPLCLSDGSLAGSVSGRDILAKVVAKGLDPRQVRLADLSEPEQGVAVDIDVSVEEAANVMCRHRRSRLPVTEADRVVGSVAQRDVVRALTFQPFWADANLSAEA